VAPPSLDEKVSAIANALEAAGIPYAFGGAIALAFYAAPRGTEDIDVNVFVPIDRAPQCLEVLGALGVSPSPADPGDEGHQLTASWAHTPIHLFFAYDPFHESCRTRAREVPFGDGRIRVLSAEDITIFKVVYDRPKDRSEVREVLFCRGERMNVEYTLSWLDRLLGADDRRVASFRALIDRDRSPGPRPGERA